MRSDPVPKGLSGEKKVQVVARQLEIEGWIPNDMHLYLALVKVLAFLFCQSVYGQIANMHG